jgi:hypothetical protein
LLTDSGDDKGNNIDDKRDDTESKESNLIPMSQEKIIGGIGRGRLQRIKIQKSQGGSRKKEDNPENEF